ncbi:MAG: glycosyltransferase [Candidatus Diapherotrites archaeon]|nr:glycosyltransferase [Candidatus Diapherotrites archaeon]
MVSRKKIVPPATVIIPAYNATRTLRACLDALQEQSLSPDEIIVVDDGSTDGTPEMAKSYRSVRVISQENQGPAKARNKGARESKNPIIVFLDSDCVPEKNWLAEMVKPFIDEKVAGVQGAYRTHQKSLVARFDQADIEFRYEKMKRSSFLDWIGSYSAAYRKDIFLSHGGFDEHFPRASGEDAEFSYRLSEKGYRLVFNPAAIVYHSHPDTVERYIHVKHVRAYWRMRMYLKHPRKAVQDSYTPTMLKFNVAFSLGILFFALISIPIPDYTFWVRVSALAYVFTFLFSIPHIWRHGIHFVAIAFGLYFLRSIAFATGMIRGFLDEKVWA